MIITAVRMFFNYRYFPILTLRATGNREHNEIIILPVAFVTSPVNEKFFSIFRD